MMYKRLYKTYVNLTNIVVRISDGTPEGKEHAVLVNAHLDSTLPSPGAADDALSVGILLECMRVLVNTPEWSPSHAIIFRESDSFHASTELSSVNYKCSITPRNRCKMALTSSRRNILSHPRMNIVYFIVYAHNSTFISVRAMINLEGISPLKR
jgi:Zn-dependent M28 family amino/carboxypeptidase